MKFSGGRGSGLIYTLVYLMLFISLPSFAQLEIRSGESITCSYDYFSDQNVKASEKILSSVHENSGSRQKDEESKFDVKYSGFTEEARAAFQYAIDIWSATIKTDVKIRVFANWAFLDNVNTLAFVTPTEVRNFEGTPDPGMWYPMALAEKLARKNLNPITEADIVATFNSRREDWYFGTDGNCPADKFDLVSVVLHELGHGLGFSGTFRVSNSVGIFGLNDSRPKVYDTYLKNGVNQKLVSFQSGTLALANQITSNSVTFESPIARLLSAASADPRIFAPNPYQPGSSISHVDEGTYENTPDALMTPYAERGKVTHDAGPIVRGILYEMGWLNTVIEHDPLSDQENLEGKKFLVEVVSDTTIQSSSIKLHYSYNSFTSEEQVLMLSLGENFFEAEILSPIQENTISYFFVVQDVFGRTFRLPQQQDQYFNFYLGVDTKSPTITHTSPNEIVQFESELPFVATVVDNIGIDQVNFEYQINDGAIFSESMISTGNQEFSFILDLFTLGLDQGDKINYRIIATDASSQRNVTTFPLEGFSSVSVKEFVVTETFISNLNSDLTEFFGDFSIAAPTGFINGAIHTDHPYEKSPDNNGINRSFVLLYPIKIRSEDSFLEFEEVVLVEPGAGDDYNSPAFGDYVIVEGSLDRETWIPVVPGYDSRKHVDWLNYYNGNIQNGDSRAIGTLNYFKKNRINLLETFDPEDVVFLRFRLFSNQLNSGWGWAIDNLKIQDQITSLVKERSLEALFPNPVIDLLQIRLTHSEGAQLLIFNGLGQNVLDNWLNDRENSIDVSGLPTGIYVVRILSRGSSRSYKLIKR